MKYALSSRQPPLSVDGYRSAARRALPTMVWAYVDGGADDEVTMRDNVDAFQRWALCQRVLAGPRAPRLETTLEGTRLALPVALAPTGLNGLSHWSGDVAVVRAAEREDTLMVLSSASSYSLEEVAAAAARAHWFQLYAWNDRELTGGLISRAQRAGYCALCLTVDVPTLGNREGERLRGMGLPPVLTPRRIADAACHPSWAYRFFRHRRVSLRNLVDEGGVKAGVASARVHAENVRNTRLDWSDLTWVRDRWRGPLYLKGVLDPDDARRAVALGVDGIIVSNHGGRQLDGAVAALDALPAVAAAVGDRATVVLDGGVRRGSDVVKAICLGARACLIGRPLVYGLAVAGEDGVAAVLRILREELERTLVLMGCPGVDALDASWLVRRQEDGT